MRLCDRAHAAHLLAKRLASYRGKHPLVVAIPHGVVPMGKILAKALEGELDVVLVRKLEAPDQHRQEVGDSAASDAWPRCPARGV